MIERDPPVPPADLDLYASMAWRRLHQLLNAEDRRQPDRRIWLWYLAAGAGLYCDDVLYWRRAGLGVPYEWAASAEGIRRLVRAGLEHFGLLNTELILDSPIRADHLDADIAELCGLSGTVH